MEGSLELTSHDEVAQELADIGFTARLLCQVSLPYREPKLPNGEPWIRRNGAITLAVHPGWLGVDNSGESLGYGFPYGLYPRLLLLWISEEIVRTQEPVLDIGYSMRSFLQELRLPTDGRTMKRVKDQMERLASSRITVQERYSGHGGRQHSKMRDIHVSKGYDLWWTDREEGQEVLFDEDKKNLLYITDDFFNEVIEHPVPVRKEAIRNLRAAGTSGLAIDIYLWLTHRFFHMEKTSYISWKQLVTQFGSSRTRLRDFRNDFRKALAAVQKEYPDARVDASGDDTIILRPSPPHVTPRIPARYRLAG